jgi:hypothetical protein
MGLLTRLLGDAATQPIDALGSVFDKLFTSDEERMQAQAVLTKLAMHPQILQAEINKIEAAHRSVFVAGWRPFIGWVCGVGFLWAFLGHPLFEWAVVLSGKSIEAPPIVTDHMLELVFALLGLGTLRTAEKLQGRSK